MEERQSGKKNNRGGRNDSKKKKNLKHEKSTSQYEQRVEENLKQALKRFKSRIEAEDRKPCHMVVVLPEQGSSHYNEAEKVTFNLIKRLYKKDSTLLLNPYSEEEAQPKPLTPNDFIQIQDAQLPFKSDDVLYISGHANMMTMDGMKAKQLVNCLKDFLQETGIKKLKLAGCHTGSFMDEEQLKLMKRWDAPQAAFIERYQQQLIEKLSTSLAEKVSQAFADAEMYDIKVYGYIGDLSEEDLKKGHYEKGQKPTELHSAVDIYEGKVDAEGNGIRNETSESIRASQARVCYVDGEKQEKEQKIPERIKENFRRDVIQEEKQESNGEKVDVELVRRMKF